MAELSRGQLVPIWLYAFRNSRKTFDKTIEIFTITQAGTNILTKYSKFSKLQRVFAYCLRFVNNVKTRDANSRHRGSLLPNEIKSASHIILKLTQSEAFSAEISALSKGRNVDKKISLFRLNPFLDKGLIKVGGRLTRAAIPESQKHPIILPKEHHITKLIIRSEHFR